MKAAAALVLAACWTTQPSPPQRSSEAVPSGPSIASLTPKELEHTWLGMPIAEFRRLHPKTEAIDPDNPLRKELFDDFTSTATRRPDGVTVASYYFGPNPPHPLYEVHVGFGTITDGALEPDEPRARRVLEERYSRLGVVTPPAFDDDALSSLVTIKTSSYDVGAWTRGPLLVVAAALPFTERSENRFQDPEL